MRGPFPEFLLRPGLFFGHGLDLKLIFVQLLQEGVVRHGRPIVQPSYQELGKGTLLQNGVWVLHAQLK
jgi:hypothetical protein